MTGKIKKQFTDSNGSKLIIPSTKDTVGCAIPLELNPEYVRFYAIQNGEKSTDTPSILSTMK